MEPERGRPGRKPLTPPGDLRPAQMAVILGSRLTLGDLGASLLDLVQRGLLGAESTSGPGGPDWILSDQRGPGTPAPGYSYESLLLNSLFAGPSPLRLSELTPDTVRGLGQMQVALLDDLHRWHWIGMVGHSRPEGSVGSDPRNIAVRSDATHLTERGREVRRKIWAFRRELTDRWPAGQEDLAALAPYVALFGLDAEPDPLVTAWLAACDHFRDPEYAVPDRSLADEPVLVFYLNWVSPPGYHRVSLFGHHDDTGLAGWAAGVEEYHPDEPSRLVRWLRAGWLATRRSRG